MPIGTFSVATAAPAAEDPLPPLLRAASPEEVDLERLQIEQLDQVVERALFAVGHDCAGYGTACERDGFTPLQTAQSIVAHGSWCTSVPSGRKTRNC